MDLLLVPRQSAARANWTHQAHGGPFEDGALKPGAPIVSRVDPEAPTSEGPEVVLN